MLTLARRLPFRPSLISDAIVRSVTGPLVGGITPAPLVDIVITLTGNGTVVEGSEYTMNIAASGDDAGTISAYEIDWGDETVEAGSAGDNTHTYADGLNSYTIRVAATHTAGVKRKNKALTVTNVAPVAALSGASTAYVDVEYTVTIGSVTDPGDDTITNYRINWGDGSYDDYASIGAKTHTYTSAEASVDITLDITDEDGTHTAVDTLNIEVSAAVVPLFSRDYSAGTLGANATFARSSSATIIDHEGVIRTVPSGAARFNGLRYVRNFVVASEDFSNGLWQKVGGVSVTGTNQIVFSAAAYDRILTSYGYFPATPSVAAIWSCRIRTMPGTGTKTITIVRGSNYSKTVTIDETWKTITAAGAANLKYGLSNTTEGAFSVEVDWAQLEDATGRADTTTPSEYVSVGVESAPYHGANVDGIKYFATENGNSVVGNVVTEGTGAAIEGGALLLEPAATNRCDYSEAFDNAAWTKSNCTITANSIASPAGATTADTLTATAANASCLDSITLASSTVRFSVYLKRKTGTGNIDLTVDGGSTWTTKAITSEWARYDITQAAVTNPNVGIRIVTSGDEVYAWGAQLTQQSAISSYIPTSGSAVTRAAETLSYSGIAADNETRAITDAGTVDTDDWDGIVDATINGADNLAQITSIDVYTTGERPA